MQYLSPFAKTNDTFEERTEADPFTSSIGRISLNFSKLEENLSISIGVILAQSSDLAQMVTSEMSYKNKVHLMISLLKAPQCTAKLNLGTSWNKDIYIDELTTNLFKAEELRNQILHSSWDGPYLRDMKATRRKITAKASRGLHIAQEEMDSGYLLDIADYIICCAMDIEELFIDYKEFA